MENHSPLRFVFLIYEGIRLFVVMGIFVFQNPVEGEAAFPWLVFAAPNALFLLMALFIWRGFSRYGSYIPLYVSGKCVVLASILGSCIFFRQEIFTALYMENRGIFFTLGGLFFLFMGDLLSVAGGLGLAKKVQTMDGPGEKIPAEAAEEAPAAEAPAAEAVTAEAALRHPPQGIAEETGGN